MFINKYSENDHLTWQTTNNTNIAFLYHKTVECQIISANFTLANIGYLAGKFSDNLNTSLLFLRGGL